jgi:hypothetical protein
VEGHAAAAAAPPRVKRRVSARGQGRGAGHGLGEGGVEAELLAAKEGGAERALCPPSRLSSAATKEAAASLFCRCISRRAEVVRSVEGGRHGSLCKFAKTRFRLFDFFFFFFSLPARVSLFLILISLSHQSESDVMGEEEKEEKHNPRISKMSTCFKTLVVQSAKRVQLLIRNRCLFQTSLETTNPFFLFRQQQSRRHRCPFDDGAIDIAENRSTPR